MAHKTKKMYYLVFYRKNFADTGSSKLASTCNGHGRVRKKKEPSKHLLKILHLSHPLRFYWPKEGIFITAGLKCEEIDNLISENCKVTWHKDMDAGRDEEFRLFLQSMALAPLCSCYEV